MMSGKKRKIMEKYLSAFEEVVKKAKPTSVMASYNRINGEFGARNKYLLTDVLRKKRKFTGEIWKNIINTIYKPLIIF